MAARDHHDDFAQRRGLKTLPAVAWPSLGTSRAGNAGLTLRVLLQVGFHAKPLSYVNNVYSKVRKIVALPKYEKQVKRLLSDEERGAMEASVAADPLAYPVVRGTGGF